MSIREIQWSHADGLRSRRWSRGAAEVSQGVARAGVRGRSGWPCVQPRIPPSAHRAPCPYWEEALGGPTTYSDQYGDETSVVRIHSGNGPHAEMDQRAIACFDQALEDVGLARDERLRRVLHDYFAWVTTTTMSRYHHSAEDVPDGLQIPKWSWQGLVSGAETDDT